MPFQFQFLISCSICQLQSYIEGGLRLEIRSLTTTYSLQIVGSR